MARIGSNICTPHGLLAVEPCIACLSEKDILAVIALLLCKINGGGAQTECDPTVLLDDAKDLLVMGKKQKLIALASILFQWCLDNDYLESDTGMVEDMACLTCLPEKELLTIILKQICDGVSDGTLICDPAPQ